MEAILGWILGIIWRAAVITVIWIGIRSMMRNGGETLRLIFGTIGTAFKVGCLKLRLKLTETMRKDAEEEETIEEEPKEIKIEGTIV